MAVGVVQLNTELQLVADFDSLGVRILQTAGQSLGHVEDARALVSFRRFVDDLNVVLIQLMLVGQDRPCDLVCVANGIGVFRIEGEVVAFDQL